MEGRLKNKIILITGGTHGIGAGIVKGAIEEDAIVVTCGRSEKPNQELLDIIKGKNGIIDYLKIDISNVDDCEKIVDYTIQKYGRIDGLVNNAAIFPRCEYKDVTENFFCDIFNVNVKGTFFITRDVVVSMIGSKTKCSIVNIGSINAYSGEPELAVYSCSKGAVHTLTRHIAQNYGKNGIRCNWITVGWVATETEISRFNSREEALIELDALAKEYIPSGRLQTLTDISNAVNFLLSDESNQITGTEIHVTGGKYF